MVAHGSRPDTPINEAPNATIDAYALFEALTGRKIEKASVSTSKTIYDDYDDLEDMKHRSGTLGREIPPDSQPSNVRIGAINPYALVEAMIGRELDRHSVAAVRITSEVLQTDYDELFDLKHHSVLFAGLKLSEKDRKAEELSQNEVRILEERDLVTPDLSEVRRVEDLEKVGLKQVGNARIKMARMQNCKLHLILEAPELGKTVSNRDFTMSINDLATRFRREPGEWTPPNASWLDMYSTFYERVPRRLVTNNDPSCGQREPLQKEI